MYYLFSNKPSKTFFKLFANHFKTTILSERKDTQPNLTNVYLILVTPSWPPQSGTGIRIRIKTVVSARSQFQNDTQKTKFRHGTWEIRHRTWTGSGEMVTAELSGTVPELLVRYLILVQEPEFISGSGSGMVPELVQVWCLI